MRGLLLAALLAVIGLYVVSQIQTKAPWARDICSYVGEACDNQRWLLIAAAALILVYALARK